MTMEIGIGLPAAIRGTEGKAMVNWARRAEAREFSTLGVIDRLAYDNYEPLVALAAAAAVTERIRLTTSILLAPLRTNHTLFAKQAASLDRLSEGRLVLGLGVGRREDDYTSCEVDFHHRGAELDALIDRSRAVWSSEGGEVGPAPLSLGGPELLLGGASPVAYRRVARHGTGWVAAGGMGDVFGGGAAAVRDAWGEAGREGTPRLVALGYFALGHDARGSADAYLKDYYGFMGAGADMVAATAVTTADQITQRVGELAEAGCDELILFPCNPDPTQVELLADALGR
jgi:alkanesulfonate monooxygenase SsuD/methylene tetrahydromethanopterin reductase-like flavin-dependent oxidoreductase (luciferase family)